MLYRFADAASLQAWEASPERRWWLESGRGLASESRVERRTGIERWFDVPYADVPADTAGTEPPPSPPRWKRAVGTWLGLCPTNLALTALIIALAPGLLSLWLPVRLLITTIIVTPVMTYLVLPLVTRWLRPWLLLPARPRRSYLSAGVERLHRRPVEACLAHPIGQGQTYPVDWFAHSRTLTAAGS